MRIWQKRIQLVGIAVVLGGLIGGWALHPAYAAAGQITLTPASTSLKTGDNVTFSLRINPGVNINAVQATLNFDTTKLRYVTSDFGSSAFSTQLGNTQSGGTYTTQRGVSLQNGPTGIAGDLLIGTFTFTALASSGSSTVSITGADAYDAATSSSTNPGVSNSIVSFTAAVSTVCPAGTTGTYPNCVTPSTGGGTTTKPTSGGGTTTVPKTTATTTQPAPTTPTATPTKTGTPPTVTTKAPTTQYTQASITVTSNVPTKAYLQYGISSKTLAMSTAPDELATTHTLQFDPKTLIPGETYYYTVVSTDATGNVTKTDVATMKLPGLKLHVGVFDQKHKPLKNTEVTLHSTPLTVKTDDKGYVTLSDVTPGEHHLVYVSDGKTYSQAIQAVNNIKTEGTTQTAPVQDFSVVYNFEQTSTSWARYVVITLLLIVIVAVAYIYINRQRKLATGPVLTSEPAVVQASSSVDDTSKPTVVTPEGLKDHTETLATISSPPVPNPGSTVTPHSIDGSGKVQ